MCWVMCLLMLVLLVVVIGDFFIMDLLFSKLEFDVNGIFCSGVVGGEI